MLIACPIMNPGGGFHPSQHTWILHLHVHQCISYHTLNIHRFSRLSSSNALAYEKAMEIRLLPLLDLIQRTFLFFGIVSCVVA